jgi:anti-anti-sigma factor
MSLDFEELQVVVRSSGPSVCLEVRGELDLASVDVVRAVLDAAVATGGGDVDVDMATTRFCDSVGLCALLSAHDRLGRDGRRLRIVRASQPVIRLLELTGVRALLGPPGGAGADPSPRLQVVECQHEP